MTEVVVLQQSPSHFPSISSSSSSNSSSSSSTTPCAKNDDQRNSNDLITNNQTSEEEEEEEIERERDQGDQGDQVSVVELLLTAFRRSLIGPCSAIERGNLSSSSSSVTSRIMQIGWPSNVRHIAHVTFDRFNGFLGLPVEFEPEVPRRPPSASANVFGVSTDSMQLSFDSRGNSVPTILLMMQRHLYAQGGLEAEGIFRITGENGQEEYVRDQLNSGVIPQNVDAHCLAGLIKAWFRELPTGLLDSVSSEQVMQCQTEEDCSSLVRLLPQTEAALLDWTVNLMADVAQMEHLNKMNARNIAMVFAPNMTQMADPLTALMYAVQVMNFLKTLVVKTLRERADSTIETTHQPLPGPSDTDDDKNENENDNRHQMSSQTRDVINASPPTTFLSSIENVIPRKETLSSLLPQNSLEALQIGESGRRAMNLVLGQCETASPSLKRGSKKVSLNVADKGKKAGILGHINSRKELVEAWR